MITLEKSDKWRQRFMEEMYANDDYYEGFIKGDVARAITLDSLLKKSVKRWKQMDSRQVTLMNSLLQ